MPLPNAVANPIINDTFAEAAQHHGLGRAVVQFVDEWHPRLYLSLIELRLR